MAQYLIMHTNGGRFGDKQLLSRAGVTSMHTPPGDIDSPYAMGWMETAPGVLEHNIVTVALFAWGLRNIDRWVPRRRSTPRFVAALGVAWTVVPALLLAGMPYLVATTSGRMFSYHALYRALPSVMTWFTVNALLGLALGAARLHALARSGAPVTESRSPI